jgi:nitrate/nitrite-specific signal transduction histidine kinase
MGERARRIGASLELGERAGGGTRVCLRVPMPVTEPQA